MQYRPAIDGLRALAALSVLFYHFQMLHFRGGFLGVDIFFVISGYLISSLVFEEAAATGDISFSRFWLRRARRILPALLCMLVGVTLFAWIFFSGTSLLPLYAKSLLTSLFSLSNVLFFSQSGYFDPDAVTKPLLHTWSLGVEEQFYLFFPLVFYWALIRARLRRHIVLGGLVAVTGVSLAACFLLRGETASAFAFFMIPTRLWELLAGTVLAYAYKEGMLPALPKRVLAVLEAAALAALAVCLLYAERTLGVWNALVVGGALLLLYAQGGWTAFLFSRKPLVAIGRLSYSLYLWHWPLVAFLALYVRKIENSHRAMLLAATFLCSFLSYRYVEQPMRNPRVGWRQVAVRLGPVMLVLCAVGLGMLLVKQTPLLRLPGAEDRERFAVATQVTPYQPEGQVEISVRHLGPFAGEQDFVIIGDSHSVRVAPIMFSLAEEYGMRGSHLSSFFFIPDFQRLIGSSTRSRSAGLFIQQHTPKAILVAQCWFLYLEYPTVFYKGEPVDNAECRALLERLMKDQLQAWLDAGSDVFLMQQVPHHPDRNLEFASIRRTGTPVGETREGAGTAFLTELVREMNHPRLHFLPVSEYFREGDRYIFVKDGKLLYTDSDHLSLFGAQEIRPALRQFFQHLKARKQEEQ